GKLSALGKEEGEGDATSPCWCQRFLDDPKALVGMEEDVGTGQDADMLGNGAGHHAEQDQRAGWDIGGCDFWHHAARALGKNLARAAFAPIPTIGRDRERLWPDNLAPDSAGQTKAIAADALEARLIVVGRAEPGTRGGDDGVGIGSGHSTAPSWPPSVVA